MTDTNAVREKSAVMLVDSTGAHLKISHALARQNGMEIRKMFLVGMNFHS